jgi:hypothetical protein
MNDVPVSIIAGYTRQRHFEMVYHDLVDLYGPMISDDGIGLWITYQRHIQRNPDHLLEGRAWPSHRDRLAKLLKTGQTHLRNSRHTLQKAGLIEVISGRELAEESRQEYDAQLLNAYTEGKARKAVRRITLRDLAAMGIQNPAKALFITVNDPLSLLPFCEKFDLSFSPQIEYVGADGQPVWTMEFDDYDGIIQGPNRLVAAIHYIEENLAVHEVDRVLRPLVTEQQILSLLRCKDDDTETKLVCGRLLERRAKLVGAPPPPAYEPRPSHLPDQIQGMLRLLGWEGSQKEVEQHFEQDRDRVQALLLYWLEHREDVDNPAAAFRDDLRHAPAGEYRLEEYRRSREVLETVNGRLPA